MDVRLGDSCKILGLTKQIRKYCEIRLIRWNNHLKFHDSNCAGRKKAVSNGLLILMFILAWFFLKKYHIVGVKTVRKLSGFRTYFRKRNMPVGIFSEFFGNGNEFGTIFSETESEMIRAVSVGTRNRSETFRKFSRNFQIFSRNYQKFCD